MDADWVSPVKSEGPLPRYLLPGGVGPTQACQDDPNRHWLAARNPTVLPAWEVLRMAAIEGAQAVGPGDEVGSLEAGKQAVLKAMCDSRGRPKENCDVPSL